EAGRAANARVERGVDVVVRWEEVGTGQTIGFRDVIPGAREGRSREVASEARRTGASQRAAPGVAAQRVERGAHPNLDPARQQSAPDGGRLLEHVEPLLADGRARIAAHRCRRRRIVEAFAGAIDVDDGDGGRVHGRRRPGKRRGDEDSQSQSLESHDYFSSSACAGTGVVRRRAASRRVGTQSKTWRPLAAMRTTAYSWKRPWRSMVTEPSG